METVQSRAGQALSIGVVLVLVAVLMAAVGFSAPSGAKESTATAAAGTGLSGFADKVALEKFARKMARLERQQEAVAMAAPVMSPPPAFAVADVAEPEAATAPAAESITNTQEAGVDEGGIVKQAGDYLVVLRRGRLFTIRIGGDALAPAGMIDAFPPGKIDPGGTWYDEMLISGRQVIVIGYSYGSAGTEINRFDIGADGKLAYRDTHYLRSGDYYSSSNYASRLIGDELVFYTPVPAYWDELDDHLPAIRKGSPDARPVPLVRPRDFLVAEPYRSGRYPLDTLHTVTRCKLAAAGLDCRASAIAGTWSHAFYVSAEAVYVWTGVAEDASGREGRGVPGQLYRIPLAGGTPGAVQVRGSPIDQFSFAEDARAGVLRVLLRDEGAGEGMWEGEVSGGGVALASVPLATFGNGAGRLERGDYRKLPQPKGWRFHNRFVGDYVLYAAGGYGRETETATVYAVPLNGGPADEVALAHGVTRFDRMGEDAIVIGPARGKGLGFTSLSLGRRPRIEDVHILPAAGEGETRSQAFFFRPDPGSRDGASGVLGLPVTRGQVRDGGEFLGSGSAIAFLRRDLRKLAPLGELAAAPGISRSDNCNASCVDWYGNARPIFTGGRIFALMGYELVEGQLSGSAITERRRASFAP